MPLFRSFHEPVADYQSGKLVAVIVGELIYANVRLRLTANRTHGLCFLCCRLNIIYSRSDYKVTSSSQPKQYYLSFS